MSNLVIENHNIKLSKLISIYSDQLINDEVQPLLINPKLQSINFPIYRTQIQTSIYLDIFFEINSYSN
jgi:hypothetical protein